jgi:hypothetical protein
MIATRCAIAAAALLLAACGSSNTERGMSGGPIGAGTGAAQNAATGTNILGGASLGGPTDEDDVDPGGPIR